MGKFKDLLKSGRHRKIEQFTGVFLVLAFCLVVTVGMGFHNYLGTRSNILAEESVYNKEFSTSRTNVQGEVLDVFTSKDKTKTLVMLKFSDMADMSIDADNYRAFITNVSVDGNGTRLKSNPSGSVYLFGSSGYMGIYLVDNDGFPGQVLNLTVRCNTELKSGNNTAQTDEKMDDESFRKYDQFTVMFNPAGSKAKSLDCLDKDTAPTVADMYNQAVVTTMESTLHDELNAKLEDMRVSLNVIKEYTNRLSGADGVNVPEVSPLIRGDSIEEISNKDGSKTLVYKPNTVVAGGWNFDWRSRSVTKGWLDELIKATETPNMTYDQYFTYMSRQARDAKESLNTTTRDWTLKDGTLLSDMDTNGQKYKAIQSDINKLNGEYQKYWGLKQAYQRGLLGELLELESTASLVDTSASINTNENVITCY